MPHEPHRQLRPAAGASAVAPGHAVVHQHRVRLAVALEGRDESITHRRGDLVGARAQQQVVACAVVGHGQRVAHPAVVGASLALEVQLPAFVGRRALEALPRRRRFARWRGDHAMTMQDVRDRARRGHVNVAEVLQAPLELASTPRRVLAAEREHQRLNRGGRRLTQASRPTRAIRQRRIAALTMTPQPLVRGLAADAEASTQRAQVRAVGRREGHKLET